MKKGIIVFLILIILVCALGVSYYKYFYEKEDSTEVEPPVNNKPVNSEEEVNLSNSKKKSFEVEVQSIYRQVATDFVVDNFSLTSISEKNYCHKGADSEFIDYNVSDCKELSYDTLLGYYFEVDRTGKIMKMCVYDNMFFYSSSDMIEKPSDIYIDSIRLIKDELSLDNKLDVKECSPSTNQIK